MDTWQDLLIDLIVIVIFMAGIAQFRTPAGARRGNITTALAFAAALALLVYRNTVGHPWAVVAAFVVGLPLFVLAARSAFEAVDPRLEEADYLRGLGRTEAACPTDRYQQDVHRSGGL